MENRASNLRWNLGGTSTPTNDKAFAPTIGVNYTIAGCYNGTHSDSYMNGSSMGASVATTGDLTSQNGYTLGNCGAMNFSGVMDFVVALNRSLTVAELADFNSYYPQCFANHLGSLYLREWATGVSIGTVGSELIDGTVTTQTTEQDLNWMAFIVLTVFSALNIFLILVPRVYELNFVVAALTLAFAAATVNDSTLPIQPYFSLIVALLSVLGILRAAQLLRNG